MPSNTPDAASRTEWTLVRNARQLLTLQGPSGARRGAALADPGLLTNGSILIRNGIVHEVGPARRVENLAGARRAREIDASGRIILPALVEAATSLLFPANRTGETRAGENRSRDAVRAESAAIRIMSKKAALGNALATAGTLGRGGSLTAGARTPGIDAPPAALRTIAKVLRVHQALQGRPLRIRSVVAPRLASPAEAKARAEDAAAVVADSLIGKWLPFVRAHKLATILELDLADFEIEAAANVARAAAGLGFAIRFRSADALDAEATGLAVNSAAISVLAPGEDDERGTAALAAAGCVRIYPARAVFRADAGAEGIRRAISAGAAIALASDSQPGDAPPGSLLELAIGAVQRLGLSIAEALTAVTWNPASALRLSGAAGSIEAGKPADLLALPVEDYREMATLSGAPPISFVVRAGRLLDGSRPSRHD